MVPARLYVPPESVEEQWDVPALEGDTCRAIRDQGGPGPNGSRPNPSLATTRCASACALSRCSGTRRRSRRSGPELFHPFERNLMLQMVDQHWREHLAALDHLRQGIHLRGYAQKNPKQEYKREAFELFSDMLDRIKEDVVKVVLTVQVALAGRTCRRSRKRLLLQCPTCAISTPITTRRWRPPSDGAGCGRARRRSRAPARRLAAMTHAPAARGRNTSIVTAGSELPRFGSPHRGHAVRIRRLSAICRCQSTTPLRRPSSCSRFPASRWVRRRRASRTGRERISCW